MVTQTDTGGGWNVRQSVPKVVLSLPMSERASPEAGSKLSTLVVSEFSIRVKAAPPFTFTR